MVAILMVLIFTPSSAQVFEEIMHHNQNGSESDEKFKAVQSLAPPFGLDVVVENINDALLTWFAPGSILDTILIVDLDPTPISGQEMFNIIQGVGMPVLYETSFPNYPLFSYSAVFVNLGIYSNNHELTTTEGMALKSYLLNGGNLYLEGGDTWAYDTQTAVHPMFNIDGVDDGTNDLAVLEGQNGTFSSGMTFTYSGENNYIDHLVPLSTATLIFENQPSVYGAAVANDAGTYKTIGCSFEFGGLDDASSPSTKADLLMEYLSYFGISLPAKNNNKALLSYNVYKEGSLIGNTTNTEYIDPDLPVGNYNYFVTAVYSEGESIPSESVNVNIDPSSLVPANVVASVVIDDVTLNWDPPGYSEELIRWENGSNSGNGYGLWNGGTFYTASHWFPSDLLPYDGMILSKIAFYAHDDPTAVYEIMIWTGPQALNLVSAELVTSFVIDEFNTITLSNPVVINTSQELWFGYKVTHAAGKEPAGHDDGPAITGKGDMISLDGMNWSALSEVIFGFDYNWNITGIVQTAKSSIQEQKMERKVIENTSNRNFTDSFDKNGTYIFNDSGNKALLGYNVYRNYSFQSFTTELFYQDMNLPSGAYDYYVTAVYDQFESEPSDTITVQVSLEDLKPLNLEASILNYFDLQIDWDYLSNPLYLEDFESYSAGDFIAVQNPAWWTTWSNQPGGSEDAPVTDEQANIGSQSIIVQGSTDAVLKFGNKTSGRYQFSFNMFIPTGFAGYFNLQKYENPGTEFGEQIYFFEDGTARFDLEYSGVLNFTYPKDAWFEVVQVVDLDSDWTRLYVDGYLIREWPFSYSLNTTGGSLQLGGLDFWAGAENGETPKYYIDDIQFREILSAKNNGKSLLGFNVYKDGVNMGLAPTNQYTETGLPVGVYTYYTTAVFTGGESDPSYSVKIEIKGPPQADFVAGITHISDGGTIHFNDLSTGTVNAWEWDLDGDGTVDSYDQNPSFTYNSAGTYSVTLTAGDGVNSNTLTKTDYISVQAEPLLINVPGDTWTIQGAVDASYDGDTVLVFPGTYYENVMCQSKDIVIASMILFTGDTSYISQTTVDGGGNGSVFLLSNQGEAAELSGFTITNGSYNLGGGLQLSNSSAEITHLKITDNQTTGSGGGMHISGAHPVLSDIIVTNNTAQTGGGIYIISGTPTIKESIIIGNTASAGAGVYLFSTSATIENNEITNNYAYTNGGGVYLNNCSPKLISNLISGNWSDNQTSGAGGIRCYSSSSPTLINNTITGNQGAYGGGLRAGSNSDPVLINNILWGNTATVSGNQVRLDDDTSDPAFMFCDVQDGVAGFGKEPGTLFTGAYYSCIEDDPLFADYQNEDFQLTMTSPCINAGNPDTTSLNLPEFDLAGNLRIQDGIIDMGCYEYTPSGNMLSVDVKVFLEGPFNGSEMSSTLNAGGQLPLTQPYNTAPWNYTGTENVTAIPNSNVVDWALVELRDAASASQATGQQTVAMQAAFLLRDGSIVGTDGQNILQFTNLTIQQSLFVVIWHRNNIGVMSAVPLSETGGIYSYDFTSGSGQAYGGVQAHKELAPGVWGMIAADGNSDGQINNSDKNDVWATQAGTNGYLQGDFSMDGQVNNTDKNELWKPNTGLGGQVPQ